MESPRANAEQLDADTQMRSGKFCYNKPDVLSLMRPSGSKQRELSNIICRWALANMTALKRARAFKKKKAKKKSRLQGTPASRAVCRVIEDIWMPNKTGISEAMYKKLLDTAADGQFSMDLDKSLSRLPKWLGGSMDGSKKGLGWRQTHPWIGQLHIFIAHHMVFYMEAAHGEEIHMDEARLILPFLELSGESEEMGRQGEYDVVLCRKPVGFGANTVQDKPSYSGALAIIAVEDAPEGPPIAESELTEGSSSPRSLSSDSDFSIRSAESDNVSLLGCKAQQAFLRLFQYIPRIYAKHCRQSFAWSLSQCGPTIRACIFTNVRAVASHAMDLQQPDGLQEYIQFVADWSLCEMNRVGYDGGLQYVPSKRCWKTTMPQYSGSFGGGNSVDYYLDRATVVADRVFGRHTRCYLATQQPLEPTSQMTETDTAIIAPQVVIKDSWRYIQRDGNCMDLDEFDCLERILHIDFEEDDPQHCLPELCAGGVVYANGARDTTDALLGNNPDLYGKDSYYYNEHVRMAMKPICKELSEVSSVYEFIVVVADAVVGHQIAHDRARILHRDVSENNIMFWRDGTGKAHGMLIDFDNCVDVDVSRSYDKPICVGTIQFMSVNNLESSSVPRTVVDDLESFLYVLIWGGTWGVTEEHQQDISRDRRYIEDWSRWEDASRIKKCIIGNKEAFGRILDEFYHCHPSQVTEPQDEGMQEELDEAYGLLQELVIELQACLFNGTVGGVPREATGAEIMASRDSRIPGWVDPFRMRAQRGIGRAIHTSCVQVFRKYAKIATARMDTTGP